MTGIEWLVYGFLILWGLVVLVHGLVRSMRGEETKGQAGSPPGTAG